MRRLAAENLEDRRLLAVNLGILENGSDGYGTQTDTYIDSAIPGTNFGSTTESPVGLGTQALVDFPSLFSPNFSFPHFSLETDYVANGLRVNVIEATINFSKAPLSPSFNAGQTTVRITDFDMSEAGATWSNVAAGVLDGVDIGDTVGAALSCTGSFIMSCDFKEYAQDIVDGYQSLPNGPLDGLGFVISSTQPDPVLMTTREHQFGGPYIRVEWETVRMSDIAQDGSSSNSNPLRDVDDIDAFFEMWEFGSGSFNRLGDLNGDGQLTQADLDILILDPDYMDTHYGDADLDGDVDGSGDGSILLANLGASGSYISWGLGNFNGDMIVNAAGDGAILLENLGA